MKLSLPFARYLPGMVSVCLDADAPGRMVLVTDEFLDAAYPVVWDTTTVVIRCLPGCDVYCLATEVGSVDIQLRAYTVSGFVVFVGWVDVEMKRYIVSDGVMAPVDTPAQTP